jgi:hypothetical protein
MAPKFALLFALIALCAAPATAAANKAPTGSYCFAFSPGLWTEGGGIALDGYAACGNGLGGTMTSWYGAAKIQYEQAGVWNSAAPTQDTQHFAAGFDGPIDGLAGLDFFWGNLPATPYSAFRWRAIVSVVDVQTGAVLVVGTTTILPIGGTGSVTR